jgi:NADH-quinone oxidoreductase subunit D
MLWLGVAAHEAGFDTLFMYSWRDREKVMDILEGLTGNRVNYSANVVGGVKYDVDQAQADAIRTGIDFLEQRMQQYKRIVTTEETLIKRTRGVGTMTTQQALELGVVGPTARASGVARDVRVEAPYAAYPEFPVSMVVEQAGDLEARFLVRVRELDESFRVIHAILDNLPPGELTVRVPRRIKPAEAVSRVEAPRGELLYYLKSNGTDRPERIKVRTPTIPNMGSVIATAVGHKLADMPMILAGIDPCFSCNDRMVVVRRGGAQALHTWEDLRRHGIEWYK